MSVARAVSSTRPGMAYSLLRTVRGVMATMLRWASWGNSLISMTWNSTFGLERAMFAAVRAIAAEYGQLGWTKTLTSTGLRSFLRVFRVSGLTGVPPLDAVTIISMKLRKGVPTGVPK